jgi:hypothetical protein
MMYLLRRIEIHLRETGMAPTRFGREALRDPRLIHDMKCGREPGRAVTQRVVAFIESHK